MIIRLEKKPTELVVTYLLNQKNFNLPHELGVLLKEEFSMRDFIMRNGYTHILMHDDGTQMKAYTTSFIRTRRSA